MYPLRVVAELTRLSKSRFCYGLQCPKQLWLRVHEPDAPELKADPGLQVVLERGHMVGEVARERFPRGVLIGGKYWEYRQKIENTKRALKDGAKAVFEAAFEADGVYVAADVLLRGKNGFSLVEVKSTLDVKEPHIPDVAIQVHVLRRAGLDVRRAELMHLNRDCRFPKLSNLFVREDVTRDVKALLPSVPRDIRRLQKALAGPCPPVDPGDRCGDPYECPFVERCWPKLPKHHVSKLYRIGRKAEDLVAMGCELIRDVPRDVALSPPAARQVRAVRTHKLVVEPTLAAALMAIRPPIAFLDFETINPAIPVWAGCGPYQHVPVQLSCHVLGARGGVNHHEFLAEAGSDPRPSVADAVIDACSDARTVVAWNAKFEASRLDELAQAVPKRRAALLRIRERVVDLLPIVRDNVYHPEFGGSFSLKAVAPALVNGLRYDNLEVADGDAASAVLETLLLLPETLTEAERRHARKQLVEYCGQDTFALVRVHHRLVALA